MAQRRRRGARARQRKQAPQKKTRPSYIAVLVIGILVIAFLMRRVATGL